MRRLSSGISSIQDRVLFRTPGFVHASNFAMGAVAVMMILSGLFAKDSKTLAWTAFTVRQVTRSYTRPREAHSFSQAKTLALRLHGEPNRCLR